MAERDMMIFINFTETKKLTCEQILQGSITDKESGILKMQNEFI
jgi:hypothetical protein